MEASTVGTIILYVILGIAAIAAILSAIVTIPQQQVGVITRFGKFKGIMTAGLNFKTPFIDRLMQTESLQNRSQEMKFQAITRDQASVSFNALLIYTALDSSSKTIESIAFKFRSSVEFSSALIRSIEGEVRAFVATKNQSEILALRNEIVDHVKEKLDTTLSTWGFHLSSLQINDVDFSAEVKKSMERVVASFNMKTAAENEGQALLITKTKAAEAEGNAIKISADAEKIAAISRGQGIAGFREEVAKGMKQAAEEMGEGDTQSAMNAILFSMYMENMKEMAIHGKGNVFFFDGSKDNFDRTFKQMTSLSSLVPGNGGKTTENKEG